MMLKRRRLRLAIESAAAIESTFSPTPVEVDVVEASAASESAAVPPEDDVEPRDDALGASRRVGGFVFSRAGDVTRGGTRNVTDVPRVDEKNRRLRRRVRVRRP
jgi:hypothetical protein